MRFHGAIAAVLIAALPGAAHPREVLGRVLPDAAKSRTSTVRVIWKKPLVDWEPLVYAPRALSAPSIDGMSGDVIVGTRDGMVRALTGDGRELWWTRLAEPTSSPVITEERVVIGGADGKVHALDRFTGEELWSAYVAGEVIETPAVEGDVVFVGTDHDSVHAIALEDGAVRWVYRRERPAAELSIRGGTGVSVGGGRAYAGFSDGSLVALAPADGRVLWEVSLAAPRTGAFPDVDAVPLYRDGVVYASSYEGGVFALDAASGSRRWNHEARGAGALALADLLYVGGATSAQALDPTTGRLVWRIGLSDAAVGTPVLTPEVVVFPSRRGLLFASRRTGKPLSTWDPGSGFAAAPAATGTTLYALSNRGFLYRLSLTTELASR